MVDAWRGSSSTIVGAGRIEHQPWPPLVHEIDTGDFVADISRIGARSRLASDDGVGGRTAPDRCRCPSARARHRTMTSDARVRVVYLTHTLGVGGAEELILNMVTRLPRDRYEPIVCCFENPPGPIGPEIAAHGIAVVPLGIAPGWRHPAGVVVDRAVTCAGCGRRSCTRSCCPRASTAVPRRVAARVPIIIGTEVNIYERKQRHHILAERLLAARSACVVASAESVKSAYVRQLGIWRRRRPRDLQRGQLGSAATRR